MEDQSTVDKEETIKQITLLCLISSSVRALLSFTQSSQSDWLAGNNKTRMKY